MAHCDVAECPGVRRDNKSHSSSGVQSAKPSPPLDIDTTISKSERIIRLATPLIPLRAWEGWATIHEKPHQVFACCMAAGLFAIALNISVFIGGSPHLPWAHLGPCVVYVILHFSSLLLIWGYGPMFAKNKVYIVMISVIIATHTYITLRLMFGHIEHVPFRNRLVFVVVIAIGMWASHLTGLLGMWAMDHPSEPYRSFSAPVIGAAVRNLRLTDALTDTLVIEMMLEKAQEPCYWFEKERSCTRWVIMAACAGVTAALDLSVSMFLVLSGSSVARSDMSERYRRMFFSAHVFSFACEATFLAFTLVKLFSDFQEPAATTPPSEHRAAVTATLVSFVVTVSSFCLTMLGMQRIGAAAGRVAADVRTRISRMSNRSGRTTANGHV